MKVSRASSAKRAATTGTLPSPSQPPTALGDLGSLSVSHTMPEKAKKDKGDVTYVVVKEHAGTQVSFHTCHDMSTALVPHSFPIAIDFYLYFNIFSFPSLLSLSEGAPLNSPHWSFRTAFSSPSSALPRVLVSFSSFLLLFPLFILFFSFISRLFVPQ